MAGFVVAPNTLKVLVHWTLHGRPQLNVLHAQYVTAGPLSPGIAQAIFAPAATALTSTLYATQLANTTIFTAIGVLDERSASNPEIVSTGAAVPGTGTGMAMPDATSLVLTERTALTGRAHRGRIYTLGWTLGTINADGTANSVSAGNAVAWYNALSAAMSAQGAVLAIKSTAKPDRPSKGGGTLPAKPYEITNVTSIVARDLIFDSNRRRTDQLRK